MKVFRSCYLGQLFSIFPHKYTVLTGKETIQLVESKKKKEIILILGKEQTFKLNCTSAQGRCLEYTGCLLASNPMFAIMNRISFCAFNLSFYHHKSDFSSRNSRTLEKVSSDIITKAKKRKKKELCTIL